MPPGIIYISITLALLLTWFCGIGLSIVKLFDLKDCDAELTLSAFWLGWSFTIIFLQIWHLIAPVGIKAFMVFSLVGVICLIWNRNEIINLFRTDLIVKIGTALLFCFIVIFVAGEALGPMVGGDPGLYHIQSIRWISSYPIIPGLGNLHGRLAFNSSYFLYVSLLDVSYWSHKSQHLANGLLFIVALSQCCLSGYKLITCKNNILVYDIMMVIFMIPLIMLCKLHASSPTPDVPIFILGTIGSVQLCKLLYSESDSHKIAFQIYLIITIGVIGTTIKITFLVLACLLSMAAFGKFLFWKIYSHHIELKKIAWLSISTLLITLLPWIVRNIILSGYLIYPFPSLSFNVEWKIPYDHALYEALWIKSYARQPGLTPDKVLANWNWLWPWVKNLMSRGNLIMVCFPLFLMLMGGIIKFCNRTQKRHEYWRYILFILPGVLSLVFWFLTAPDPRFAGASFWYLGTGTLALGYQSLNPSSFRKAALITLLVIVSTSLLLIYRGKSKGYLPGTISEAGFYRIPSVKLQTFITNSGLAIYTPKEGDYCWDAPLPATPYPNPNLRLREAGNISKGFMFSSGK